MRMQAFHLSSQGASHIKKNKECQDASESFYNENCAIAIVCDGHGGDDYVRSASGSAFACAVAKANILNFIENIDKDDSNDKATNVDEEITLHSGETTTLRKEAEKYDMTIEQNCDRFELAEGDCPSEKIETVRKEEEGPDTDDDDEPGGRGERPTPEEEALDRLLNRH